jgi:hypothetical protein
MKTIKDTRRLAIVNNLIRSLGAGPCDVEEFQRWQNLTVDNQFGFKSFARLYELLLKTSQVDFRLNHYLKEYPKDQLVYHWTHGWDNARGVFNWWAQDGVTHVATAVAINDEGELYRGFDEAKWAHHIGVKTRHFKELGLPNINTRLNNRSVAIEICNWGPLIKNSDGTFTPVGYVGKIKIDPQNIEVVDLEYRGHKHFERIKPAEIETAKIWGLLMSVRFDIPLDYNKDRMWTVNSKALKGEKGIYSHGSFRKDKCDVHPQEDFVEMLKGLVNYEKEGWK